MLKKKKKKNLAEKMPEFKGPLGALVVRKSTPTKDAATWPHAPAEVHTTYS